MIKSVDDTGSAAMECFDGHVEFTASETIGHTGSCHHRMPPVHSDGGTPYVLISDIPKCERPYVLAMNTSAACPVPDGMAFGHHAYYVHDYKRWYDWRMARGDDWREQAQREWWYAFVYERTADP